MIKLFLSFSFFLIFNFSYGKVINSIPYSTSESECSKERCQLDIYVPDSIVNPLPVVVWFHGGGLTGGERFIPEELMESDLIVVSPSYRLLPNATIDDCIDDAAAAVAWTFNNIKDYGGDTKNIFVAGHSAGGYLASMIGLQKKWLTKYGIEPDSIAGLFPYSGQAITHFEVRRGKGMSELHPMIDEYAPLYHVRKDAPPYIIITGDAENELFGRYEENLYLWRMLKLIGHPDVKIYKLDGYDHGSMEKPAHHILKNEINRLKN